MADYTDSKAQRWVDDPSIPDSEPLYRRIPPRWFDPQPDGTVRIASGAFDDDGDGDPMSVYIGSKLQEHGLEVADTLHDHDGFGLAVVSAGDLRKERQVVLHDPLNDESRPHPCDPAHGLAAGPKGGKLRKRLRNAAEWAIAPQSSG